MNQKLLVNAKTLLQTRRTVAVIAVQFVPKNGRRGFRKVDYAWLARDLERFEKLASKPNVEILAITAKRHFVVRRHSNGPSFAFEQHLLTDPLFCDALSRVIRNTVGIVNDSARPGSATISLFARNVEVQMWTRAMPVHASALSELTLDVPLITRPLIEYRDWDDAVASLFSRVKAAPRLFRRSTSAGAFDDISHDFLARGDYIARRARTSRYQKLSIISSRERQPPPPSPDLDSPQTATVFYATDRKPTGDKRPRRFYGCQPDKRLHLGVVTVSMPPKRPIGKVVTPSILKIEFRANPMKHLILKSVKRLAKEDYYERMNATMAEHHGKRAFVFVHGYNVTFEDAALRTAQLHQDLKFEGAPIFYSWPSKGTIRGYKYEAKVGPTHLALEEFLREVVARTGADEIHVIAHSMGNRAVTAALDRIFVASGPALPFSQLIFAAPDLDADHFEKIAAKIHGAGKRLTLYGSSKDKAIQASKTVHQAPRAGDGGRNLVVMPDVDSIDASALDTDFLSHSYISDHSLLLHDVRDLVTKDAPPDKRLFLQKRKGGGWRFQPES